MKSVQKKENKCIVCGTTVRSGEKLCECCRESLMLCDLENYISKKVKNKICVHSGANAFK